MPLPPSRTYGEGTYGEGIYGQVFGLLERTGLLARDKPQTPHFDLPFRIDRDGHAAVVEQDSEEDVGNCVAATLRTVKGQRLELPGFGINDPTFQVQPLDTASIIADVIDQEPRAAIAITQNPDRFDSLVADLVSRVSLAQGGVT